MTYITEEHIDALYTHPHWDEWCQYHAKHPETAQWLNRMAHRAIENGHDHGSVKWLVEAGRWETGRDFSMGGEFRDWYSAIYARWLMVDDPSLDGFFELRKFEHERGEDKSEAVAG